MSQAGRHSIRHTKIGKDQIDVTATSRIFQRIPPTPTMTSVERLRPILPGWDNYHIFLVLWEEELCSLEFQNLILVEAKLVIVQVGNYLGDYFIVGHGSYPGGPFHYTGVAYYPGEFLHY